MSSSETPTKTPTPEQKALAAQWPSVNALVAPLVHALKADAQSLRLAIQRLSNGCTVIDAGIAARGGIEAGRRIAEICMGGLGQIAIAAGSPFPRWSWQISVTSRDPVLACLGSQYAGWSLSHGEGKGAFQALGSGPGRAVACREELFAELAYRDGAREICLVLETDKIPPPELADKIARYCSVTPDNLTLVLTPTQSLSGSAQIVARVLEVALHKVHVLGFPLHQIVDGAGAAPLPPPSGDFITAMGRSNDAILFGGQVHLFVAGADDAAQQLAHALPSSASKDYGKPFARVFKDVKYDFYRIDPHLFAPALVQVTALASGKSWRTGALDPALLEQSFG